MPLQPSFLAAENSVVERRSERLHRTIAASPVLLLIAVGLVGHLRRAPHPTPSSGATYDAQVLAFRERVVATQDLRVGDDAPADPVVFREAKRWTDGLASGRLVPIEPVAYEDHLLSGVRGEILRTGIDLAGALLLRADHAFQAHRPGEALEETLTAAELAHGLRGFEIQAMLQTGVVQRRAVALVAQSWPMLSRGQVEEVRRRLPKLITDSKEVERMALHESEQLLDYRKRQRLDSPFFGDAMRGEIVTAAQRSVATDDARIERLLRRAPVSVSGG